ncbi:hypothetical protein LTR70_005964 [Exophiala xenobiotica]|uniref:Uncharacterized protein n=1 Tax=Lithohypha guttulata TaxID=1690604 RepID=A0ABR0K6N3_9EURO|nr:hypothetical protein LTR24_006174 [Lithohypha guttulata]KAK5317224.1 hypothetical protein LTR70_005964 [Exophiala xenobiotica]
MLQLHRLLALPPALLGVVLNHPNAIAAQEVEWPYNLPPHVKYYPEDEGLVKRNLQIQQKLQQQTPAGIRKMSGDPGEKFFLDYWQFEQDEDDLWIYTQDLNAADRYYHGYWEEDSSERETLSVQQGHKRVAPSIDRTAAALRVLHVSSSRTLALEMWDAALQTRYVAAQF